jgi:hypothetical protein
LPWLVTLSRHKHWTFAIPGVLIALSFLNTYLIAPRLRARVCSPDNPSACDHASSFNRILLWVSAGIYLVGFLVAYVLGPTLARIDRLSQ